MRLLRFQDVLPGDSINSVFEGVKDSLEVLMTFLESTELLKDCLADIFNILLHVRVVCC